MVRRTGCFVHMPYRAGPRVGFLIDMRAGDMRRHHMDPAHGHGTIWHLRMHKISEIVFVFTAYQQPGTSWTTPQAQLTGTSLCPRP